MVVEGVALKPGLEHWMVEGRIKRGILKQCMLVFILAESVLRDSGFFLS
jgi:hypothetical protein